VKRIEDWFYRLHPYALCCVAGPLTVGQIVVAFALRQPGSEALHWGGWIALWTSAVFGWLPIITLRSKGGVAKGQSYMQTKRLVDTGIYAIVRQPQMGTAWLLICVGLILITQHWASVVLGIPALALAYLDLLKADQRLIEKFGDPYRRYMRQVPRVNFVTGVIRLMVRQTADQTEA
jgi:protein-S-isoprenylcysteine O-methyltransferase Ste14